MTKSGSEKLDHPISGAEDLDLEVILHVGGVLTGRVGGRLSSCGYASMGVRACVCVLRARVYVTHRYTGGSQGSSSVSLGLGDRDAVSWSHGASSERCTAGAIGRDPHVPVISSELSQTSASCLETKGALKI